MRPSRDDVEDRSARLDGRYHDDPNEDDTEAAALLGDDETFSIRSESHDNSLRARLASRYNHFVEHRIPKPLQSGSRAVVKWVKGPQPPHIYTIEPFFPTVQTAPIRLVERFLPKRRHKAAALVFFYFLWILTFTLVLQKSSFATEVPGYGKPVNIDCTARYWYVEIRQSWQILVL
jgi:hypothetical protein